MSVLYTLAFALAVGLTFGGAVGSLLEAICGARLRFVPPFVTARRLSRSLIASAVVGPFMLLNEALAARHENAIGAWAIGVAVALALLWTLAIGIVVIDVVVGVAGR